MTTQYDIIPLLWNVTSMATVPDLYRGKQIPVIHHIDSATVAAVMPSLITLLTPNAYTQIEASQEALSAPFIYKSNLPSGLSSDSFLAEAEYQHHYSYPCVLGVPSLLQAIVNAYEFSTTAACASSS